MTLVTSPSISRLARPHVAVDEIEAFRRLSESFQPLPDALDGPREELLDPRSEPHAVAPGSPVRPAAQRGLEIPGEALEARRPLPVAHVVVHAGGDLAEDLEGAAQVLCVLVRLLARFPAREHHVARPRQVRVGDELNELAVASRHGDRGDHRPVGAQRTQPGELGGDAVSAVVALAVHPQRPARSGAGDVHPVGGVLGDVDEGGGGAVGEVVAPERRIGEASDRRHALLEGQIVEFGHPFPPVAALGSSAPADRPVARPGDAVYAAGPARDTPRVRLTGGRADSTIPLRACPPESPARRGDRLQFQDWDFRGQGIAARPVPDPYRGRLEVVRSRSGTGDARSLTPRPQK